MTSPWKMFKNAMEQEAKPWHLLTGGETARVDKEVAEKRYAICQSCPVFIHTTKQCRDCGCFMNLKVLLKSAQCPLLKW